MRRYIVGAVLMGFGGMLAGGCAVGAGVSGGALFAVTAWVTLTCIWISATLTDLLLDRGARPLSAPTPALPAALTQGRGGEPGLRVSDRAGSGEAWTPPSSPLLPTISWPIRLQKVSRSAAEPGSGGVDLEEAAWTRIRACAFLVLISGCGQVEAFGVKQGRAHCGRSPSMFVGSEKWRAA